MTDFNSFYRRLADKVIEVYNNLYNKELTRLKEVTSWAAGYWAQAAQEDNNRREAGLYASFFAYEWLKKTRCSRKTVDKVWRLAGIE